MSTPNDNALPHSVQVFKIGEATVTITPCVGYLETRPVTGFIRTQLRGEAPTLVNMARALMGHAQAVLDEAYQPLSQAECVAMLDAFAPLWRKVCALSQQAEWLPSEAAQRKPEG